LRDPYLNLWLNNIKVVLILLLVPDGRSDFIFELVELLRVLLKFPFVPSISLCGEVEVLVMETLGEPLPWLGGPWGRWFGEIVQLIQFEVCHPRDLDWGCFKGLRLKHLNTSRSKYASICVLWVSA
jgi:hypothetical protein